MFFVNVIAVKYGKIQSVFFLTAYWLTRLGVNVVNVIVDHPQDGVIYNFGHVCLSVR